MSNDFPNRQTIRLPEYDYSSTGLYFITICTQNQDNLLGAIANGSMVLNEFGKIVENEITNTANIRDNVQINDYIIMPNHVHLIITINPRRGVLPYARPYAPEYGRPDNVPNTQFHETQSIPKNTGFNNVDNKQYMHNCRKSIDDQSGMNDTNSIDNQNDMDRAYGNTPLRSPSQTVGDSTNDDFDCTCRKSIDNQSGTNDINVTDTQNGMDRAYGNTPLRSPSQTIGAVVRGIKGAVAVKINIIRKRPRFPVWQRNYYEHIIRNEESYQTIANYIKTNPEKWATDKFFRE